MKGYVVNIEEQTNENGNFRKVLYTAKHSQLVLMCLQAGEEIGAEVHEDRDQFFRFETGQGKVVIDGIIHPVGDGDAVVVPAGSHHNVINDGAEPLRLYTLYSPPEHRDGTVHMTKSDAIEEHFDGRTSE